MKKLLNKITKVTSLAMAAAITVSMCVPVSINAASVDSNSIAEYAEGLVGDSYPNRRCLQFVEEVYQANGANRPYTCCALGSYDEYVVSASQEDIPIGAAVYFQNCGGGPATCCGNDWYGHVGIYAGDGYFIHATGGKVQKSSMSDGGYWDARYIGYGFIGNELRSNNDPIGYLDSASANGDIVTIRGWTFDYDDTWANLDIHIYVGGNTFNDEVHVAKANKTRDDVNNVYGINGKHGYDITFRTNCRGNNIPIYVYAINTGGGSNNPLLGVEYVNISESSSVQLPDIGTSCYIKAFTVSSGNTTVYSNKKMTQKLGTAYASDELRIYEMTDDYVYCSYPITGTNSRKYGYIPRSKIALSSTASEKKAATASVTTYQRASSSTKAGYISAGDIVYKLGTSGDYVQVLYNIGSSDNPSGWRMAWIKSSSYDSYVK